MKILSISIDQAICDPGSSVARRQIAYFQDQEAYIVVLAVGASEKRTLVPGITVERIGGRSKSEVFCRGIVRLIKLSKECIFDVVTSQDATYSGYCAWLFARMQHVPFVVQLHGDYLDNPLWIRQKWSHRVLNVLSKRVVHAAQGVRCVSERLRHQVVERFGVPLNRTISLPICTDLSIFSPIGSRHDNGPYVLFVGRLHEEKEPMLLCDVMIPLLKEKKDLKLAIAGKGALREAMEKRFASEGVQSQVLFLGQQSSAAELAAWYRSAICLIHPSSWEGWGMVMIESMACGCPVVTTDTGCAGEAVRNGENGFVVPIGDVSGLRESVRRFLDDEVERKRFSENAVLEAARWNFVDHAKDQAKYFAQVIQSEKKKCRLLITVQAVDLDDPLMGFFHGWLVAASKQFDQITVLALRVGRSRLPSNVVVIPLRPNKSRSRWLVFFMLLKESWGCRAHYDAVFVRGDIQYLLLAGWLWRILGKRIVFWYAHYTSRTSGLRFAPWIANQVVTSVPAACTLPGVRSIGQAIDVSRFVLPHVHEAAFGTVLIFGRISPIKRVPWMIEKVAAASPESMNQITIVGRAMDDQERDRLRTILQVNGAKWEDRDIRNEDAPELFRLADIYINATPGSLDKTIVEAMMSGLVVVASSPGYGDMLPPLLAWLNPSDEKFGSAVVRVMGLSASQRHQIGVTLRQVAMDLHGQDEQIIRLRGILCG